MKRVYDTVKRVDMGMRVDDTVKRVDDSEERL